MIIDIIKYYAARLARSARRKMFSLGLKMMMGLATAVFAIPKQAALLTVPNKDPIMIIDSSGK